MLKFLNNWVVWVCHLLWFSHVQPSMTGTALCPKRIWTLLIQALKTSPQHSVMLTNERSIWCHLIFYLTSYVFNMFRTLIYPSSGACDCVVELPHRSFCSRFVVCWRFGAAGLEPAACNTDTTPTALPQVLVEETNLLPRRYSSSPSPSRTTADAVSAPW